MTSPDAKPQATSRDKSGGQYGGQ